MGQQKMASSYTGDPYTNTYFTGTAKDQIARNLEALAALNPERAAAYKRDAKLLNKSLSMASSTAPGGSMRMSTRRGFDVGLANLDNYRGRDPVRAFGSTRAEHELMLQVTGTPVSERRQAEILRDLPIRSSTSVELLHGLHHFSADTDHLLRQRAAADPILQPEFRERARQPVAYTPYSKRHFTVG